MAWDRGGYAPLEYAGEYVCDCLRDGDRIASKYGAKPKERIVRCKDCRWFEESTVWPGAFECANLLGASAEPLDFCSWGERKED